MAAHLASLWNLTPHEVTICTTANAKAAGTLLPSGEARAKSTQVVVGDIEGVAVVTPQAYSGVNFAFVPPAGEPILVSMIVGDYIAQHPDVWNGPVYCPDTSPDGAVRDARGNIVGCKRLVRYK